MKFLKLFRKNKDGVTAIEFAILAPVFFLLFMGIIEVGLTMFVDSSLNAAIRETSRKAIGKELTIADRNAIFQKHMAGLYNDVKLKIVNTSIATDTDTEIPKLKEISDAFIEDPENYVDNGSYEAGDQSGRIVVYVARYQWGGFSGLVAPFLPEYLYAVTVVRNEDY